MLKALEKKEENIHRDVKTISQETVSYSVFENKMELQK